MSEIFFYLKIFQNKNFPMYGKPPQCVAQHSLASTSVKQRAIPMDTTTHAQQLRAGRVREEGGRGREGEGGRGREEERGREGEGESQNYRFQCQT